MARSKLQMRLLQVTLMKMPLHPEQTPPGHGCSDALQQTLLTAVSSRGGHLTCWGGRRSDTRDTDMVRWTEPPTAAIMTAASSMPTLVASPCAVQAFHALSREMIQRLPHAPGKPRPPVVTALCAGNERVQDVCAERQRLTSSTYIPARSRLAATRSHVLGQFRWSTHHPRMSDEKA